MKTCNGCGTQKDYLEFHKNKTKKDGYASSCKVCHSASNKAWKQANAEKLAASNKAYRQANPEKVAAIEKAWQQANPEKVGAYQKARNLREPEKYRARYAVGNAIRDGRLSRPQECSSCNVSCEPEGHHDNYDEPLNVRWLCRKCHTAHHVELNELKEA